MIQEAKQGHRYLWNGANVLALENASPLVRVLVFDSERPWLGCNTKVHVSELVPQPMTYFHGQIPQ
jgi:hypothetical protein